MLEVSITGSLSVSYLRYTHSEHLHGALHWIRSEGGKRSILCFCLESERLQSFASPLDVFGNHNNIMDFMGGILAWEKLYNVGYE